MYLGRWDNKVCTSMSVSDNTSGQVPLRWATHHIIFTQTVNHYNHHTLVELVTSVPTVNINLLNKQELIHTLLIHLNIIFFLSCSNIVIFIIN